MNGIFMGTSGIFWVIVEQQDLGCPPAGLSGQKKGFAGANPRGGEKVQRTLNWVKSERIFFLFDDDLGNLLLECDFVYLV